MEEVVRYNYRLRPGVLAERALLAEWDRCRFLWNGAVHQQKSGGRPTFGKLGKYTGRGFSIRDGKLRLPKGTSIPVVWSRELPSDPTSVRITRDSQATRAVRENFPMPRLRL